MVALLSGILRPFGVALGAFILLNAALALRSPELAVTRIWLQVPMDEPVLSLFAAILGLTLVLPHSSSASPNARCVFGGVLCAFGLLVSAGLFFFYRELFAGRISTDLPVPLLEGGIVLVITSEFFRVMRWRPSEPRLPAAASVFFRGVAVLGAFSLILLAYIVSYGRIDFRGKADAAVIFGAKVYPDGRPCDALVDRLEAGIEAYREGRVRFLIMTGGRDPNGQDEPKVMARYAVARGVSAERIILDSEGRNTRASASNCRRIAEAWGFDTLLAVSQYFHCARVKLAFDREQLQCLTMPTCSRSGRPRSGARRLSRETFFLMREVLAFPVYWLFPR